MGQRDKKNISYTKLIFAEKYIFVAVFYLLALTTYTAGKKKSFTITKQ